MSDKIPDIVDYSVDFPEVDYDFAEARYFGNKPIERGPFEFSEPRYIMDDGMRYPTHFVISEVNEDGSLKTDIEMRQRLIELLWTLIVDYWGLQTNMAGEFNEPVIVIDEYIDECYGEVNYHLGKAPASRVIYRVDPTKYAEIAYDFVVNIIQEVMSELAEFGESELCEFLITVKKY